MNPHTLPLQGSAIHSSHLIKVYLADGRGVEPPWLPSHHGIQNRLPPTQRDHPNFGMPSQIRTETEGFLRPIPLPIGVMAQIMAEDRGLEPQRFHPLLSLAMSDRNQSCNIFRVHFGTGGEARTPKTQLLKLVCYANYIAPARKCIQLWWGELDSNQYNDQTSALQAPTFTNRRVSPNVSSG